MAEQTKSSGAMTEILIVEDSPVEAELLRRTLERAGYRVPTVARNGEEGLRALREHPAELVISDINMPLMDGYEMCRTIKFDERLWSIPVILVTMLSEPKDIIKALGVGADSYITKPYVEAILLGRIRALLDNPLLRKLAEERRSIQVEYGGENYNVAVGGQQMANLLLSVYENSLILNHELMRIQSQLNLLNDTLDEQVRARTAELFAEKQNLVRVNRALRTLSACNVALVRAKTKEELFQTACRHIVEIGEHLFAAIFFPGEEPQGFPCMVSDFGGDPIRRRLTALRDDPEYGSRCPTVAALQARQTRTCNVNHGADKCGMEKLAGLNIGSASAFPLLHNGDTYGTLTVFSTSAEAFDAAETKLMEELAGDIAYGIFTLRTRAERDRANAELRHTLEQTITAIALTLEKRDPYSAGHQQRVAKLATAIAAEMGLPQQQIEGIHFGALLHNIGVVSVPAEIINRPAKLDELQFALIKQHPLTGFEIVKDIHFPWPVAQMVLQHHERIDGSGYPHGLKGGEIILEARILAVSDVFEAMTAYRPYRDVLKKEAALDALVQGRGAQFDADVVDACLRVVKQSAE